jgi:competence protein ComEA
MGRITLTLARCVAAAVLLGAVTPLAATGQEKPAAAKAASAPAAPVNLNTATQAQLETLPGIGAATAKRILEYRQKTGGFKKIEERPDIL